MTFVSKLLSILTFLLTIIPIVVFGRFDNEFLRLNIIFSSLIFTYFANEHYIIRLLAMSLHVIVLLGLDYLYMREYIMQLACYTKSKELIMMVTFYRSLPRWHII